MEIMKKAIGLIVAALILGNISEVLAKGPPETKHLQESVQQIEHAKAKIKDVKVHTELDEVESQEATSDAVIDESLNKVEGRGPLIKLIVGPDQKNAGQVRSEVVHLQNQVRKLDNLGATDAAASLSSELAAIQLRLSTALQGVSLFGWLTKFLGGFTPPVTPTPTPMVTIVPTVDLTPTVFVTPTAVPTPTP